MSSTLLQPTLPPPQPISVSNQVQSTLKHIKNVKPRRPHHPPLTTYVERSLTTILKASSDDVFDTVFDGFYAKKLVDITFNGQKLSRDAYKQQIRAAANANNTVSFGGIVSVPSTNEEAIARLFALFFERYVNFVSPSPIFQETGFVGTFVTASFPFVVVLGGPVDRTLNSSINLVVQEDDSLKLPAGAEQRRVFSVDQVSVDKTGNVTPQN